MDLKFKDLAIDSPPNIAERTGCPDSEIVSPVQRTEQDSSISSTQSSLKKNLLDYVKIGKVSSPDLFFSTPGNLAIFVGTMLLSNLWRSS